MKCVKIGIAFSIGDGGEDAADTSGSFSLSRESPSESFKVFGDPVDILKYDIKDYNSDSPDGRRQTKICHLILMERKESKSRSAFTNAVCTERNTHKLRRLKGTYTKGGYI